MNNFKKKSNPISDNRDYSQKGPRKFSKSDNFKSKDKFSGSDSKSSSNKISKSGYYSPRLEKTMNLQGRIFKVKTSLDFVIAKKAKNHKQKEYLVTNQLV